MSAPFSGWPWRAAAAEFMATGFLLIAIVGSGIAAERLSGGNVGLALLANAIATGGALFALTAWLTLGSMALGAIVTDRLFD
jgi:glycerol uptake facilitator-like aquaporin